MRRTVTLDDDVAAQLEREMCQSGKSFKRVVNDALRAGLALRNGAVAPTPFVAEARPLGARPGLDYANVVALLEGAEEPAYR